MYARRKGERNWSFKVEFQGDEKNLSRMKKIHQDTVRVMKDGRKEGERRKMGGATIFRDAVPKSNEQRRRYNRKSLLLLSFITSSAQMVIFARNFV